MSDLISQRERRAARVRKQTTRSWIGWAVAIAAVIGLLALLIWNLFRPPYGEAIPDFGAQHIPEGTGPGEYNSDPPTSGPHYPRPLDPGFYEEADLAEMGEFPHAYAVHNLEHGYIVFWYNCDLLSTEECEVLKTQIREYMDRSLVPKLIAFPWHTGERPLVLTSWGYRLEMPVFDAREASRFISANRLRAPEPNGR